VEGIDDVQHHVAKDAAVRFDSMSFQFSTPRADRFIRAGTGTSGPGASRVLMRSAFPRSHDRGLPRTTAPRWAPRVQCIVPWSMPRTGDPSAAATLHSIE
jgi:hypothetical protein